MVVSFIGGILNKTDKIIHTKNKKQTYRSRTNKNPQDHKTEKVKSRVNSGAWIQKVMFDRD
jgi:hypothetical protein